MTAEQHIVKGHVVLLVEDDVDDQEMLVQALKEEDPTMTVLVANTGSKAFEILRTSPEGNQPCLIVLDYNLPEVSGAEILMKLREMKRYQNVIKVVWSTSSSPVYEKKSRDAGADHYIVKPGDYSQIRSVAQVLVGLCNGI